MVLTSIQLSPYTARKVTMKSSLVSATIALVFVVVGVLCLSLTIVSATPEDLIYGYECRDSKCVRVELNESNFEKAISQPVCRLFCSDDGIGTVWPKPTGPVKMATYLMHIDIKNIELQLPTAPKQAHLWDDIRARFMASVEAKVPDMNVLKAGGYPLRVEVLGEAANLMNANEIPKLTLDTDESYTLKISGKGEQTVLAQIIAQSFFGARHGLETLLQLMVYDDIRREIPMLASAEIHDAPAYKWRGLLLDTSRNFYTVKAIKRTLDAMAMVKLNTFHWHITDSHSFPLELKSQPELHKLGAYSPRKVYSHAAIRDIVEYGKARGIRVLPEFDAPAHVGEGWQHKNMTACFNAQPWLSYCVEPPCGQLDPTVDALYPVLGDIYGEMIDLFAAPDVFHMGGDEVSVACWKSSERIRDWMVKERGWDLDEADFLRLWGHFQSKALERVDSAAKEQQQLPPLVTLWTSRLTEVPYIDEYLDNQRYLIQIWTKGNDPKVQEILKRGFRIIISNYDALYFDCGGAGWVTDGQNWCSPYIGWQKVYDNSLQAIAGDYNPLVLGAEAAIWSEQIDETTLDARFWPRASALAERLWSNPQETWRSAEARMLYHRERLVEHGIGAEALQPEWCLQHENECPKDAYTSQSFR